MIIDMYKYIDVDTIIRNINTYKKINKLNQITINFNNIDYCDPVIYTILSSWLSSDDNINSINIDYSNVENIDCINYLSRINFMKNLNINYDENFTRHSCDDRLVPITLFYNYDVDLISKMAHILTKQCNLDENILYILDHSLNELIENIDRHADTNKKSALVLQNFHEKVRVCICDNGIGIPNALRKTEKYIEYSDSECISLATQENVKTEYENIEKSGQGQGLYLLKKFIEENKGELLIYSNKGKYSLKNGKESTGCSNWEGTIIIFEVIKKNIVTTKKLFGDTYRPYSISLSDNINSIFEE